MMTFSYLTHPTRDQIAQILFLYQSAGWWDPEPGAPAFLTRMVSGSHCFLIVETKGDVVGMGRAISDGASDAYIQDVAVRPEYKHQGIGSQIVRKIVDRLKKDGISWVGLVAERHSHDFYRQIGFTPMPNSIPMSLSE